MKDALTRETPALSADAQAIEDLLTREIDAFFNRDFDAWSACYLHSARLRSTMMSHELGLDIREGWEAHADGTRLHFETERPTDVAWSKTTDQIVVRGDMAWLTCRARASLNLCMMGESYELWVLERHDEVWKIAAVNVMAARSDALADTCVAVDAEGRVVALTDRSQAILEAHPAFTVRQGRLRAVDTAVDRELQAAIGRAGALHGYFEQAAYAEMEGQRFAYPIVLERAMGEGHEIVMLRVQDRLTYVDFEGTRTATAKVDASALIFGLSEAQHRVALGVVAGQSLPEVAREMGISPETAKTHLGRVYEKTGTSRVAALVRTLLSVG